ncbi:hypothetical protein DAKH74_005120 [Maudiozyma humilis]|uniref:Reverse transcriptase domain-containing protein n=1 Tax=Maudiozyma humilis TaxID=51915 RepID=A0AAV5RQU4_MAUHU|nr:hypothetical protein DAKH74_005120 [Kazachstania humilis]
MCCNFRGLNETTVRSRYSLPRTDDLLDMLTGSTVFSQLDFASGFPTVEVHPEDQEKTTFVTPLGQYIYLATSHSYILDDILICSKSMEEHQEYIKIVLELSCKAKLYAKKKKEHFFMKQIHFLGYTSDEEGIHVDGSKIEAMAH